MSLLDDVSLMITPNGVAEDVLFGVLPQPIIGAEKVTDGDFPTGTSAWTTAAGWAIANGAATCSSGNDNLSQDVSAVAGKTYKITLDVTLTSGRLDIDLGGSAAQSTTISGFQTFYITAVNTTDLRFYGGAFRGSVSNVSVREYTSADMDFTRATTATRVNGSGNIEEVPRNLLKYSEDLTNSFWNTFNIDAIVASTIPSPDGSAFGFKAIPATGDAKHYIDYDYTLVSVSAGVEVTYSIYVKPFGYTNFQLTPSTGFNSGSFVLYQNFELTGDGVKGTGNVNDATIEKIGDWYRCSITETATDTNPRVLNLALPSSGLGRNPTFEGNSTDGVLLWGGQIEGGASATTYIPTTDRLNVPRIDYTGGGCPHILSEPQRTNLLTYSEDFSDSSWTKQTGITATYNTTETLSPDGTNNATKLIGTGSTGVFRSSVSVSGNISRSVYLKSVSGSTTAVFKDPNATGGATAVNLTITNDWQRFELIGDNGTAAQGLWIDDITSDGLYMWGAQLELGSYATSYIPTSGSTVTRNADTFTRTGIGDLIGTAGVLYLEVQPIAIISGTQLSISLSDGTLDNRVMFYYSTAGDIVGQVRVGGGTANTVSDSSHTETDFNKIAIIYQDDKIEMVINGGSATTTTGTWTVPSTLNQITFTAGNGSNNPFRGNIRNLQVYKTALTVAQCQSLTS
tara:strand:- start:33 stop:2078 length:2046 start_codon:yes stop_codon:yes gene_type:complete